MNTTPIKAKTVYETDGYWGTTNTEFKDAQWQARREVLRKYIRTDMRTPSTWEYKDVVTVGRFGRKKIVNEYSYVPGRPRDAGDAIDDLMKFYTQILSELKAIDEMKVPTPETKH